MNTRHIHLSILALAFIVALTSCNRYNAPELVSVHPNKHKETINKQPDETTLAFQQRERIDPIANKPVQVLPVEPAFEKIQPLAAKNNRLSRAVSHAYSHKINEQPVKTFQAKEALPNAAAFNKAASTHMRAHDGDKALCAIISIFIPFLGVGLYEGIDTNFWIDLILSLIFWIPGIIFALIVILSD